MDVYWVTILQLKYEYSIQFDLIVFECHQTILNLNYFVAVLVREPYGNIVFQQLCFNGVLDGISNGQLSRVIVIYVAVKNLIQVNLILT